MSLSSAAHPNPDRWPIAAFGDEIAAPLEEQLEAMRASSVHLLELRSAWGTNVVDLSAEQLDAVAGQLAAAGVAVCAIGSPVGKAPIDGDLEAELGRLRAALAAAERLGAPLVRIFSFYVPKGEYEQHRDEVLRRMSALAHEAQRRGVTLVHENESHIYGDRPERCLEIVEKVASPALRVVFDPANFVQVGVRPMVEAWPLLGPHVAHVHVKDAVAVDRGGFGPYPADIPGELQMGSVRLPGQGEGDLPGLLVELDRIGYAGCLSIEPHLTRHLPDLDGPARFSAAVRALRGLLDAMGGAG